MDDSTFVTRIDPLLRGLFRTAQPVATLPVPGAMAREIVLDAAIEHRALVLVAGGDGEALAATAESLGKEVLRLCVAPGRQVEQAHLLRFLQGPPIDTVVVAHVESTTGAEAPLAELADVLRLKPQIHLLVDATGSLGASPVETDRWSLDTVLASADGALGLPHGVSFVALSPRALKRALGEGGRGKLLDLVAHQQAALAGGMLAPLAAALERAVEDGLTRIMLGEGLTSRWERQSRLRALVETWVTTQTDLGLVAVPGHRSATLSWLSYTAGVRTGERMRLDHAGETTIEQLQERLRKVGRGE